MSFDGQAMALARRGDKVERRGDTVRPRRSTAASPSRRSGPSGQLLLARARERRRSFFLIADSTEDRARSGATGRAAAGSTGTVRFRTATTGPTARPRCWPALVELTAPEAIDLVTFASDAPRVATLTDAAALRAALGRVIYRGGTSLAGLDAAGAARGAPLRDAVRRGG